MLTVGMALSNGPFYIYVKDETKSLKLQFCHFTSFISYGDHTTNKIKVLYQLLVRYFDLQFTLILYIFSIEVQ